MKKRLNSNFAYMNTKLSSLTLMTLMTLLLLLLTQSALAQSDAICNPFDGDIDDDDNQLIEICHLEDLDAMRYQLDGTGYTTSTGAMKITAGCPDAGCNGYELSRDLDFLEDASYRDAAANKAAYTQDTGWQPVGILIGGLSRFSFSATFNGNRYTLSNLRIDRPNTASVALFGSVFGGRIMNVALLNVRIRGLYWVGGLVGRMTSSRITGSYATGGSVEGTDRVGNVGGVGALIGDIRGDSRNSTISGNYANLTVTAHFVSGGLIGFSNARGSGNLTISNNYAVGSIAAETFVGGFIAAINGVDLILRSSSNYASGVVTGKENVSGFIGSITGSRRNIHFTDNYWDSERSKQRSSADERVGQITSLTTVQMTVPTAPGTTVTEAYHNWSEAHWDFGSRYDYPVLRHTTANSALGQKVGDLLGHQRPAAKLNRLLLGVGERTLPLDVEQAVHRQSVDFDTEQISLSAESDAEAILHINGTTATSGEMRIFDLPVAQTTTLTLTLSQPYYVWPRIYAVEVYRKAKAELSELNVSAGQLMPSFNPQTTFYTLSVSATTETLIVTPVASDPKARIEVDGGVAGREIALREGTTTISILVAARDRIAQTTYTLAVWRPDARLQALSVPNGVLQPEFAAEHTTYTAAVFGADRVQLVARAPRGATIEVNDVPVASGQPSAAIELMSDAPTRIVVMVTAGDGVTTQRYVVWATRQIGTQAQLATLSLPNIALTPPFKPDSEQRTYTATVVGISEVTLTASAALGGRLEKITVNGTPIPVNRNGEYAISLLRMGAQATTTHIVITVESEDQSTQTHYRVAIQRQPSSDAQLTALSLSDGTQAVPLSPSFSSTRTAYTATAVGTRTITLTATASRHAKFTVNGVATASGQPSPIALSPSTMTNITLIVTAEDATTTMSYTVAVAHQPSPEAQLTALSLSDGTQAVPLSPPFSATQTTYTATLTGQISAITLTATVSRHATLTVKGVPTASGHPTSIALSPSTTTTITLIVSAEDGIATTAYTLQIITTARPTAALRVRSRIFLEAPLP